MTKRVEIDARDLYELLVNSQRYAMGRATVVPHTMVGCIQTYWKYLQPGEREVLCRDLTTEITRAENQGRYLGHQIDHSMWVGLRDWMYEHTNDKTEGRR